MLYRSLCDSSVQYTYFSIPYAGKPDNPNEFYVTGTDSYTEYLVTKCKKAFLSGRNISMDNYFTSVSIARWCWEQKIIIVGTWKQGRKGMTPFMHDKQNRAPQYTVTIYNDENMTAISFADEKSKRKNLQKAMEARAASKKEPKKDIKVIVLLSTMHNEVRVSQDIRKKPHPFVYYDHTKGGVDALIWFPQRIRQDSRPDVGT